MTRSRGLNLDHDPEAPLLIAGGQVYSRGDLLAFSDAIAGKLEAGGHKALLVQSDRTMDLLAALDATDRLGVNLFIAHTTVEATIVDDVVAEQSVGAVLRDGHVLEVDAPGAAVDHGVYMMTSGTTGRPKLVLHTLDSLLARARRAAGGDQTAGERWLLTYQPTGFAGIQVQLTAAMMHGVIVAPAERTPAGFRSAAIDNRVTHISATPTFWRALLMMVRPGDLILRQITLGGEAADQVTLDRLRQTFPEARVTHTYASTEAGVVYAVHDGREGFPTAWLEDTSRPVQLRVRDGRLEVLSGSAMRGYVGVDNQPLQTDGWLTTSDRVEIREDRVIVIGRDDATINVAGAKVYPLEVERVLLGLPGIAEAKVYGMPNPISGALVAAEVVLAAGNDQSAVRTAIAEACRVELAQYKRPRIIKFVESIATSASGKKG